MSFPRPIVTNYNDFQSISICKPPRVLVLVHSVPPVWNWQLFVLAKKRWPSVSLAYVDTTQSLPQACSVPVSSSCSNNTALSQSQSPVGVSSKFPPGPSSQAHFPKHLITLYSCCQHSSNKLDSSGNCKIPFKLNTLCFCRRVIKLAPLPRLKNSEPCCSQSQSS